MPQSRALQEIEQPFHGAENEKLSYSIVAARLRYARVEFGASKLHGSTTSDRLVVDTTLPASRSIAKARVAVLSKQR